MMKKDAIPAGAGIDLVVDYEDQEDWLQDSIVIKNVDMGYLTGNHDALIRTLEQAVIDETRSMYNPPSRYIEIMGYAPADSDVTVKRGVNFWTSDDNIFTQ